MTFDDRLPCDGGTESAARHAKFVEKVDCHCVCELAGCGPDVGDERRGIYEELLFGLMIST